jgi:hypothetical protein
MIESLSLKNLFGDGNAMEYFFISVPQGAPEIDAAQKSTASGSLA